jgi:hypothetical protein
MAVSGEVVFQRIFDLGGTLNLPKARALLGPMAEAGAVQPKRLAPEYVSFAAPVLVNLASLNLDLRMEDNSPLTVSARLYEVGALALMLRLPFRDEKLSDLGRHQHTGVFMKGQLLKKQQALGAIVEELKSKLKPAFDEMFDVPVESENYTAFCLTGIEGDAASLLKNERAQIAGLLTSEPSFERLSDMEVDDTLNNWSNYFRDDLVVADWDAGLVVEPSGQYEDILYIFEVANLELLELRKYDLYLDATLDRGYEEYEQLTKGPALTAGRAREMVRELGEVRMDLAKVTDELANTAKFFGDWYIARVYMGLASKLHIKDYHKTVEEKLATLNDLYQSVLAENNHRQALVLEIAVVLLIVMELVLAIWRH